MNTGQFFRQPLKAVFILVISIAVFFQFFNGSFTPKPRDYTFTEKKTDTVVYLWTQLTPLSMNIAFNVSRAWKSGINNYLILAGGRINNLISPIVMRIGLQPRIDTLLIPLPFPVEKAGGIIIKDSLYIFGGASDFSTNYRNTVYKLNLTGGVWVQKNYMPVPLAEITYSTAAVNDSTVYIAGGRMTGGGVTSTVLRYNPKTDTWSMATPLPAEVYGGGLGVLSDSTLIFVGGRNLSTVSQNIYRGKINVNNPNQITWSLRGLYPAGPVYNPGCWGTRKNRAVFTCGTKFLTPVVLSETSAVDSVYGNTYFYNDSANTIMEVDIKPTPVTHAQVDGFVTPAGNNNIFDCYVPGGAITPAGSGSNKLERLSISEITGILKLKTVIPERTVLYPNHPNPFNSSTKIKFAIPDGFRSKTCVNDKVMLTVYDILGKEIAILVNEQLSPGIYEVTWSADEFPGGIYFYRLQTESFTGTKKMLLIK